MHVTKKRPSASDGRFFVAVVRFFPVIGQAVIQSQCGCPILCGYRTRNDPIGLRLSDSFRLSDKQWSSRHLVVGFFPVIGQAVIQSQCGCPILRAYRTSGVAFLLRLSDSSKRPLLFIYVRADESDKDRHQQYDRE